MMSDLVFFKTLAEVVPDELAEKFFDLGGIVEDLVGIVNFLSAGDWFNAGTDCGWLLTILGHVEEEGFVGCVGNEAVFFEPGVSRVIDGILFTGWAAIPTSVEFDWCTAL